MTRSARESAADVVVEQLGLFIKPSAACDVADRFLAKLAADGMVVVPATLIERLCKGGEDMCIARMEARELLEETGAMLAAIDGDGK